MDEVVINSAQLSYPKQFGIDTSTCTFPTSMLTHLSQLFPSVHGSWLLSLINAAPYLCCATVSCWLNHPLHRWLGWKRAIFVTYFISSVGCIWSAVTNTWWHLLISRFFPGSYTALLLGV
ncbi:hypothetical protein EDC04DRAFT_2575541 [Pisolithus marmoratus]|nr:hypothetical protein EDC04DRAFT_2575541 [Pisolithus marmoratus]